MGKILGILLLFLVACPPASSETEGRTKEDIWRSALTHLKDSDRILQSMYADRRMSNSEYARWTSMYNQVLRSSINKQSVSLLREAGNYSVELVSTVANGCALSPGKIRELNQPHMCRKDVSLRDKYRSAIVCSAVNGWDAKQGSNLSDKEARRRGRVLGIVIYDSGGAMGLQSHAIKQELWASVQHRSGTYYDQRKAFGKSALLESDRAQCWSDKYFF